MTITTKINKSGQYIVKATQGKIVSTASSRYRKQAFSQAIMNCLKLINEESK